MPLLSSTVSRLHSVRDRLKPTFQAWLGGVIWAIWAIAFSIEIIELALGLMALVFVPLLLDIVVPATTAKSRENKSDVKTEKHSTLPLRDQLVRGLAHTSLPFAIVAIISLTMQPGFLSGMVALIWALFTFAIAACGLYRLLSRGWRPLEETVIDIGLIYLAVGGGWFVLSRVDAAPYLPYPSIIVDLTAIHFHYAAFALLILTGAFGRWLWQEYRNKQTKTTRYPTRLRIYPFVALGIILGPAFVAIGLDQGPPLELILVSIYVIIIFVLCMMWVIAAQKIPVMPRVLLCTSALILIGTMILSFLYSLGLATSYTFISIPGMIQWHGAANAFGFTLLAILAWRYVAPPARFATNTFPISRIRGNGYIGSDAVYRYKWNDPNKTVHGLIDSWDNYAQPGFSAPAVHPLIHRFYTGPNEFTMEAAIEWQRGFRWLSHLSHAITKRMGQLNVPPSMSVPMEGEVVAIRDTLDGRRNVRAWIRRSKHTNEPIFTALYSTQRSEHGTYMNIALPLYRGVMSGILRPLNDATDGLLLTSKKRPDACGDEGIYMTVGKWTLRTPLEETFHITVSDDHTLSATHRMRIFAVPFLSITYTIRR